MAHDLRVQRLQLRPAGGEGPSLKLGVTHALQTMRLQGTHLPPGAVLVVRRLEGPAPFPHRKGNVLTWQRELVSHIDRLAAAAPRPARQHVPADALAVLFADDVELLLCYTRDRLAGRSPWYWHNLFPGIHHARGDAAVGPYLVDAWLSYPHALPATLAALKPLEVRQTLSGLGLQSLSRLAYSLHEIFSLPEAVFRARPIASPKTTGDSAVSTIAPAGPGMPSTNAVSGETAPGPLPPWQELLPPALQNTLSPRAAYFAGLCYTLARRPQLARDRHFARDAAAWLAHAVARTESEPAPGTTPTGPAPSLSKKSPAPATGTGRQATRPSHSLDLIPDDHPQPAPSGIQAGIHTRLAGAFYLVNLLDRLHLPQTLPALAALNSWELLAALTAGLLDERYAGYQEDPLWRLFSDLAGLELESRPWGESLPAPPSHFLLPPVWPAQAGFTHLATAIGENPATGRCLWGAGRFLLAELDPSPTALAQVEARFATAATHLSITDIPIPELPPLDPLLRERLAPPLAWWLVRLLPYLRFLLEHLLGDPDWLPETFLGRPATVAITRTHVDVQIPLESIDMRARRAGLDRNPGWQPAFARIITFHFAGGTS